MVTSNTNSITHGLTSYVRCKNKLLLVHRPIIQVSAVESRSIWDTCTTLTTHLIIDESIVNQTKCSLVIVTTAYVVTIRTAFPALSTVVQMLLARSWYRYTNVEYFPDSASVREHRHHQNPFQDV